MILPILLAFGTSLQQVMPSIEKRQKQSCTPNIFFILINIMPLKIQNPIFQLNYVRYEKNVSTQNYLHGKDQQIFPHKMYDVY